MSAPLTDAQRVAMLNDAFRTALGVCTIPGAVLCTPGFRALGITTQERVLGLIRQFEDFSPDNDPYGEHDFGSIDIDGQRLFWKIDVYADDSCEWGSAHPSDPERSYRVLTILLASEY